MNADVLISRCRQGIGSYGLRVEERPDAWYVTWSFALDERRAGRAGYGEGIIHSQLRLADHFRGCPHCEANSFVMCWSCRHFTCWMQGDPHWTCQWCQASGTPGGAIGEFDRGRDV